MRDADLRAAMVRGVGRQMGDRRHLLVPEVDIRWSVPARIDALLVSNRICGFEIKSEADSLARLPRQVEAYGAVVERAVLVLAPRHLEAGLRLAPGWWGIWVAPDARGEIGVKRVRGGGLNPSVSPLAVLSFMPRDAIVAVLRELGYKNLSGLSVDELRSKLNGAVPRSALMRIARDAMLDREDWRSRALLPLLRAPSEDRAYGRSVAVG